MADPERGTRHGNPPVSLARPLRVEPMTARLLAPLAQYAAGQLGIVREIEGGADFIGRLAGMGLAMGAQVEVLQNLGRGSLLVRVRETRIALGRGEAAKILLEEATGEQSAST